LKHWKARRPADHLRAFLARFARHAAGVDDAQVRRCPIWRGNESRVAEQGGVLLFFLLVALATENLDRKRLHARTLNIRRRQTTYARPECPIIGPAASGRINW